MASDTIDQDLQATLKIDIDYGDTNISSTSDWDVKIQVRKLNDQLIHTSNSTGASPEITHKEDRTHTWQVDNITSWGEDKFKFNVMWTLPNSEVITTKANSTFLNVTSGETERE